jgi:hypothetical protein
MFQHIGMLELTAEATETDRAAIRDALLALPREVPGLRRAVVGLDAGLVEGNADLHFRMEFDDRRVWSAYRTHPAHVAVIHERIAPVLARATFVQVEEIEELP